MPKKITVKKREFSDPSIGTRLEYDLGTKLKATHGTSCSWHSPIFQQALRDHFKVDSNDIIVSIEVDNLGFTLHLHSEKDKV